MAVAIPGPAQFWIFTGGSPKGPFTLPQIQAKLTTGEATWGTKICPIGETVWRPLHRTPGVIPDAQRPLGTQAVPAIRSPTTPLGGAASRPAASPALRPPPSKPRDPRKALWIRRGLIGAGVVAILAIGYFAIHSALSNSFEGYERGYGDTVLRYLDRPYDGAKWTQLKETSSFSEMVTLGNTPVTELHRVAGWDDNNLWVANQTGHAFQLRDGHWQYTAKPDRSDYPRIRVVDQSTLLITGCIGASHLFRLSPGNVTDIGEVNQSTDGELFPADRDLVYSYRWPSDVIKLSNGERTHLKVDLFKEATIHRKDNTPLKEHLVGGIRHVRSVRQGLAFGVSSPVSGKKKLVRYENDRWLEFADLTDKAATDMWLSGSVDAPHAVLIGTSGWVYVQPATGAGAERTLAVPPDTTKMNLIAVWGTSPQKFWVMDEHGTVWEMNPSESRIVVRGMRRDDVTFKDAWVSPTGAVFAITTKHLYRLD